MKHHVTWNTVCGAVQNLPWRKNRSADNPRDFERVSVPAAWPLSTNPGLRVQNKYFPRFDDQCRRSLDQKQEAHARWNQDRSRVS